MNFDYLVVYCSDPAASANWYESALGLRFTEEQHGGPVHYSTKLEDGTALEFYPATGRGHGSGWGSPSAIRSASPRPRPSSLTPTGTASRSWFAPRHPDPAPRWYPDGMEKKQLSEDARRLIAYRISQGGTAARIAFDYGIGESDAQRIAVTYYPGP